MKHVTAFALATMVTATNMAQAETSTKPMIVVELFTSQGCYSCPPADKILKTLAADSDILALSMHVDYWDYLGWKDTFGIAKFGERQARYNAQIMKRARRVTPQMIFNGIGEVAGGVGQSETRIKQYVAAMRDHKEPASMTAIRDGQRLTLELATNAKNLGTAEVNIVEYLPKQVVKIKRGENAGKTIEYTNIVKSFETVAKWNTSKPATIKLKLEGNGHYAVIVQGKLSGPVYAARKIPTLSN